MKKYNCTICGAGCYSADETKTLCAECETDGNLVEVVRCKDCKHQRICPIPLYLKDIGMNPSETDYCSYGERRAKE